MKPAGLASSRSYYKGAAARLSVVRDIDVFAVRELAFQLARLEATLVYALSLFSIVPSCTSSGGIRVLFFSMRVDLWNVPERQKERGSMLP